MTLVINSVACTYAHRSNLSFPSLKQRAFGTPSRPVVTSDTRTDQRPYIEHGMLLCQPFHLAYQNNNKLTINNDRVL